jgi:tetratricopeptide (TPR) repeat protein
VVCLPILFGCAFGRPVLQNPSSLSAAPRIELDQVPFFAQEAYQCGPAALAMVLRWSGLQVQPDDLVHMVYVPDRHGSLQAGLIGAARRYGYLAYPIHGEDCLLQALAVGYPVIVLQNLGLRWIPKWHYAVVIGYDLTQQEMVLHSGLEAGRRIAYATFARTWKRADQWGLLVLPVGRLPACAQELDYLKAVLGLEQSGQPTQTLAALQTAVEQWPGSAQVHMALGNALYAQGAVAEAAQAFEEATRLAPDNGAAFNNLAHTLAVLGRFDQAEAAARQAIRLGGVRSELYRQTLNEILMKRP